ncbi:MAG: hypothetical protein AAGL89_16190, partial [Pseudomonadota bacterium]
VGQADDDPSNDATEPFLAVQETAPEADVAEAADLVEEFDAHVAEIEAETPAEEDVSDDPHAGASKDEAEDEAGPSDMISRVMQTQSDAEEAAEAPSEEVSEEASDAAPQVRIVRMKRADFEAAQRATAEPETPAPDFGLLDGAEDLDEYLEDSDYTDAGLESTEIDLDLQNALAAADLDVSEDLEQVSDADVAEDGSADAEDEVEAAEAHDDASEDAFDEATSDAQDADEAAADDASAFPAEEHDVDGAALDRLMSEADAKMEEPEGSRRRDAIAQLKAAVAAKEAARQVGDDDDDDADVENAFRNDLSEAVEQDSPAPRPRPVVRPVGARTERPRPAPLKLVAAQRVDLPAPEPRDTPVRPRRVAAPTAELRAKEAGSFAEFADKMGATELPDLLEAAAAYTAFVEGADEFSRPQLLRRVRAITDGEFNREDGLRSFTDLLRAGRFTKVRNGRFQVADDTRFKPDRQAS